MRILLTLCFLTMVIVGYAQKSHVKALPEFVYIPPAADKYVWERVWQVKGNNMFNNSIVCTDSVVYSFGGIGGKRTFPPPCDFITQLEMNSVLTKGLRKDALQYPGMGFRNNIFFIRDSIMYIGGGLDSCHTRYAWNDFWQYDMTTHAWKKLKDLPFYYSRPPYIFTENKRVIVLISQMYGEDFRRSAPLFYEYDAASDLWTVISKELPNIETLLQEKCNPTGVYLRPTAFKIEDDIYVLLQNDGLMLQNGSASSISCGNVFLKFNLTDRIWTNLPPFPGWLWTHAFAVSDGVYGYIGGGRANSMAYRKEVYRYDPELQKWERITDMPRGVVYAKGWRFKGETFVGFGLNDKENSIAVWKLKGKK